MANGYYERGEIYFIRFDNGFGSEEGAYRPGLIVSNNKGNVSAPTVNVCYLTTQPRDMFIAMETMASGKISWILANQIATVDKARLGKFLGALTPSEMREFDARLEEVFDLGYIDDVALKEKDKEIEAIRAEKEELMAEIIELRNKHEDEMTALKVENTMWQRLYDKALGQVVDMKFTADVSIRQERKPVVVEEPKKEEAPVNPPEPPQDDRVDINNCTQTALKKVGFSLAMARAIVTGRPYESVSDLKRVPGLSARMYRIAEPKVCCTPIAVKKFRSALPEPDPGYEVEEQEQKTEAPRKANINTMKATELQEILGISVATCYNITGYRKKHGPYKNLEELRNVKAVFPGTIDKLRDKLEV